MSKSYLDRLAMDALKAAGANRPFLKTVRKALKAETATWVLDPEHYGVVALTVKTTGSVAAIVYSADDDFEVFAPFYDL